MRKISAVPFREMLEPEDFSAAPLVLVFLMEPLARQSVRTIWALESIRTAVDQLPVILCPFRQRMVPSFGAHGYAPRSTSLVR